MEPARAPQRGRFPFSSVLLFLYSFPLVIALILTLTNRCHASLLRSCERGARTSLPRGVGGVGLSLAHGAACPGPGLT